MNPFRCGRVVTGEDFCPRQGLVEDLRNCLSARQNVVILGERRVGKTSLIFETVRRCRGLRLVYAQFWAVKTLEDLVNRLLRAITTMQGKESSLLEHVMRTLGHLRPRVEVDPGTGKPSVTIAPGTPVAPSGLHGVFDLLERLGRQHRLAVALDEFQDILQLENPDPLLGEIRGRIQRDTGSAFIFAGSIRHEMEAIVRSPASPFFKSMRTFEVPSLPRPGFQRFLQERFAAGKRRVSKASFDRIMELAQDNPSDIQQFCAGVWDVSNAGDRIEQPQIEAALRRILAMERKGYETQVRQLTGNQVRVLRALARLGGKSPLSRGFLQEAGIALPASARRALTRLVNLDIVYGQELDYKFFDPFLRQWVLREL